MNPILALTCALSLQAQGNVATIETQVAAERWRVPQSHSTMDMAGVQLHRTWERGGYLGLGGWGAVRGEHGGFIALGLSGGWRLPLTEHLRLDTGGWLGGGGVGRAGVGGGLMLRTQAVLAWQESWGSLGLGISRVRFPNGTLASTHGTLSASFPCQLALGGATRGNLATAPGPELGWRSFTLLATAQRYQPRDRVLDQSGLALQTPIDLAGLEARLGLGERGFLLLDLSGAAGGQAGGYMDVLGGIGYAWPLDGEARYSLVGRLEGGPAGGGKVDVGGGMAWKAMAGMEVQFVSGYRAGLSLGHIATPGAGFKGTVLQLQAGRHFDLAMSGGRPIPAREPLDWSGWGLGSGWQRLSDPQRTQGAQALPADMVSLQILHDLGNPWFAIGQGNFALTGKAGGFGQGLLGVGLGTEALSTHGPRLQAQFLVGAAGGGGISTGGGILFQPMVGLEQLLTKDWSLRLMGGRCIAPKGDLNTHVLELSVMRRFQVPTRQRGAGL